MPHSMKRLFCLLPIILLLLVGCRAEPSLVGTWKSEGVASRVVTFHADGTLEMGVSLDASVAEMVKVPDIEAGISGSYTVTQNRISVSGIGAEVGGLKMESLPEPLQEKGFDSFEGTLSWKNSDSIIISGGFLDGAYKRVTEE